MKTYKSEKKFFIANMSEWFMELVLKASDAVMHRRFESYYWRYKEKEEGL